MTRAGGGLRSSPVAAGAWPPGSGPTASRGRTGPLPLPPSTERGIPALLGCSFARKRLDSFAGKGTCVRRDGNTNTTTTHGGKREGAGRKPGTLNTLPYGVVQALKAQRLRVPADASPEAADLAGRSLERLVDVLEGRVHSKKAANVLKAATYLREQVCGPMTKKLEVQQATTVNVVNPYAAPPSLTEETQPE